MNWVFFVPSVLNLGAFIWWWMEARRARVLRRVLEKIVTESFTRDHQGTWQLWAQTMGTIDITVSLHNHVSRGSGA